MIYNTHTQPCRTRTTSKKVSLAPLQAVSVCFIPNSLHLSSGPFFLSHQHRHTWYVRKQANSTGNTLGAATNTIGKGVQGVTDATGNVVAAGGKGLGDAVTGVTQGVGDTTKGMFTSRLWVVGVFKREREWGLGKECGKKVGRMLADMR